ncbi:TonB family protein [Hymenobacter nivis]|uniref:TonB family protein n=1 Tax=Hymenobacter nivis TaxID=1850093 RepID=A0A502H1Q4_9BACT|nr:TonB family protein [Hymenobacter nivis]
MAVALLAPAAATAQKRPAAPPLELLYPVTNPMPQLPGGASSAQAVEAAIRAKLTYRPAVPVVPLKFYKAEVTFTIGPDGRVRDARAFTEQEEAFGKAVVAAASGLPRFAPGRKEGQPVPVRYTLTVGLTEPRESHPDTGGYRMPPDWPDVEKWVPVPPRLPTGEPFHTAMYADLTRHPLLPPGAAVPPEEGIGPRLAFTVDKTGRITDVLSVGTCDLAHDRAMLGALARLPRYEPGRNGDGQPVAVRIEAGVSFPPPGAPAIPPAPLLPTAARSVPAAAGAPAPGPAPSDPNKVYIYVEQMPQLPGGGGNLAIYEAIRARTVLPPGAGEKCQGRVSVSFVVRADGRVTDAKITNGLDAACDAAVLAAVRQLPRFVPGMQNGQAVAVSFAMPVLLPAAAKN